MKIGDKVRMTKKAFDNGVDPLGWKGMPASTTGVLVGIAQDGSLLVKRDKRKTVMRYHPDFWEKYD